MIFDAADFNQLAMLRSNDAADVFIELLAERIYDGTTAVFRSEDNVVGELCE